jgi:hypothetical protein
MKKILFATTAAIFAASGLSSFKTISKSFVTYGYFQVYPGSGNKAAFYNSNVNRIAKPSQNPCTTNTPVRYDCVIGFTMAQITVGGFYLKTASGAQVPRTILYLRTAI